VRERAAPRIFLVIWLTGEFGLRVREALALQRNDIIQGADPPYVDVRGVIAGARKSLGRVYIRPGSLRQLRDFFQRGVPVAPKLRRCRDGGQGSKTGQQKRKAKELDEKHKKGDKGGTTWQVPKSGFLLAACNKSKRKHLHYNAVWNQCVKLGPLFLKELERDGACCDQDVARVRPHSGRATFITQLMSEGVSTAISLKYSRHKPSSIKTHLRYGQLTLEDLRKALDKSASPGAACTQLVRVRGAVLREASQVDLRAARQAILAELKRRGAA
jgi:integrase